MMSVDLVLRAIATLTCMYTAGMFITLTSIAALSASGTQLSCGPLGCLAGYEQRIAPPIRESDGPIAVAAVIAPGRV
jgi:hypothetical protein